MAYKILGGIATALAFINTMKFTAAWVMGMPFDGNQLNYIFIFSVLALLLFSKS